MFTRDQQRVYQRHFSDVIVRCFHTDPKKRLPGAIFALEPGAGKTSMVLTAARDLLDCMVIDRVLICSPLLPAVTTWPEELADWEHLRPLSYTVLRAEDDDPDIIEAGAVAYAAAFAEHQARFDAALEIDQFIHSKKSTARAATRAKIGSVAKLAEPARQAAVLAAKEAKLQRLAAEPTEIHIINKEALPWLWKHFGNGRRWPYQLFVIDDCREGRSGKKRVKVDREKKSGPAPLSRFGVMAAIRRKVGATIQLTGTPTPKGLPNLWGLAYTIDLGERLGSARTDFEKRWFNYDTYTRKLEPKETAFAQITGKVKDIMFSLDPENMPKLPPFIMDPIRVKLSPTVLARYKQFKRDSVSEEYDVEAVNAGVLHGKLLQFANGSMYQEDGEDVWVHDAKIEALRLLVERLNGTPLLVAYTYQFDVERIRAAFPESVLLRPDNALDTVRRWNRDEIPLLLAHRASAAHGLNMQKGTGHMAEYGLTSDAELYLQFLKRLLRPGRNTSVFNHVIIAEGTIDEEVFPQYLDPKIREQADILEAVRASF